MWFGSGWGSLSNEVRVWAVRKCLLPSANETKSRIDYKSSGRGEGDGVKRERENARRECKERAQEKETTPLALLNKAQKIIASLSTEQQRTLQLFGHGWEESS